MPSLRTEAATDERRDNPDVARLDLQRVGKALAGIGNNLHSHVHGELAIRPFSHRRMRLHRRGMLCRRWELCLELHRRLLEGFPEIAGFAIGFVRAIETVGLDGIIFVRLGVKHALVRVIVDIDEMSGVTRLLQRLGNDEGDGSAVYLMPPFSSTAWDWPKRPASSCAPKGA